MLASFEPVRFNAAFGAANRGTNHPHFPVNCRVRLSGARMELLRLFPPQRESLPTSRRWIRFALKSQGILWTEKEFCFDRQKAIRSHVCSYSLPMLHCRFSKPLKTPDRAYFSVFDKR
jgi:hypothetical protein